MNREPDVLLYLIKVISKQCRIYIRKPQMIDTTCDLTYYFLGAFFLPATVLRFPLRVRLFVRVR
jgi:hypothetical protein